MSKHVVIIGAGPGGLATALLLARTGARVTVLERLPHVGGRTSTFEQEGFRFDLGPTFFLYPQALERVFAESGHDLHREVELIRLDPQYRLIFGGGGQLACTADLARMERELAGLNPHDAGALRRFLDDNRVRLDRFRPILEAPFRGWYDLLRWPLLRLLPQLRPWLSLDGELARYFQDPRVRLAFSFQSKYLGMSPFQCPGLFSILSFLEYEHGVYHPRGGCGSISTAMARLAADMGVDIRLGEEVQQVELRGHRAVGVRTRRGPLAADALVINADFAHAMRRLVPDAARRRWTDARIARKKFSCSTFMMYLGIKGRLDHLDHHTVYLARDYVQNLADIESRHVLSGDPSFYVQNACVTDPGLAPPGHSSLYVLAPVTHQHPHVDWDRERAGFRSLLLRQMEKIGIDRIEERICCERVLTPADWEHGYAIHQGATFNLAHTLRQMLHLRPRNRFEDLQSVYLVGGGTHPGSGLPVIFESARITARLLRQDLGLPAIAEETGEEDQHQPASAPQPVLAASGG